MEPIVYYHMHLSILTPEGGGGGGGGVPLILPVLSMEPIVYYHMHLSILTPEGGGGGGGGGWRDSQGELDNLEKSLTNSPPIGKNFVSKIPWMGHQICYIIYFRTSRKSI